MRSRPLTSDEQVLSAATKAAVQVAGGLDICARETRKSDTQLSRCCSRNSPDSLSIRDAAIIDGLRLGDAAPQYLSAMARIGGFVVVPLPTMAGADDALLKTVAAMMSELGDVATEVALALGDDGQCSAKEARRIIAQLDEHDTVSARLRTQLAAIAAEEAK